MRSYHHQSFFDLGCQEVLEPPAPNKIHRSSPVSKVHVGSWLAVRISVPQSCVCRLVEDFVGYRCCVSLTCSSLLSVRPAAGVGFSWSGMEKKMRGT